MKKEFCIDLLHVSICDTRMEMAEHAALKAGKAIISMLQSKSNLNIIFAAAPSQDEFLNALICQPGIDWEKINAFHMDEYIGLPGEAPQAFGNYLNRRIFKKVPFGSVNLINGQRPPEKECSRYTRLLQEYPADIVFMGIGENGHIAFNDPHVALFEDPELVKIVDLDLVSRIQQVHDGCFNDLDRVPRQALTLTIPALLSAKQIFCVVPGKTKAKAALNTVHKPIIEEYPSTILRKHPSAELFLDADSAKLIDENAQS
jgi:glucosamine-6-phosphate deaminase